MFNSYLNCSRFFASHTKFNWLTSKNLLHLLVTIRKLCSEAKPHFNWYRVPGTQKMLLRQQERLLEQHTTIGMMPDVNDWIHMMAAKMFFNACSQDEAHPYQKASLWCWWQDQWMTLEHPFSALAIATLADVSVNVQQQTHEMKRCHSTAQSTV